MGRFTDRKNYFFERDNGEIKKEFVDILYDTMDEDLTQIYDQVVTDIVDGVKANVTTKNFPFSRGMASEVIWKIVMLIKANEQRQV